MQRRWIKLAAIILILSALTWYFTSDDDVVSDILVSPQRGQFEVNVINSGELRSVNSTNILGPTGTRQAGIWQMKIEKIIPEGTVVDSGDYVAELDKTELESKIQEGILQLQKVESQYTQSKLDTSLTLSQDRDNLINLKYVVEEKKLAQEQAVYEPPSVQRQTEIDYERAVRNYKQAVNNYQTKVLQAEAKVKEAEADFFKEKNKLEKLQILQRHFTVRAPKAGMVVYKREWDGRKKNVGSTVSAWDPVVAELPDMSIMESVTYINEVDIQKIKKNQIVTIGLDAIPDKTLSGIVTEVANIGEQRPNSDSKVFEVVIRINESDSTLRPAMTTSNAIRVYTNLDVLFIPLESVFSNDTLTYIFKKDGLSVVRQEVELSIMNERNIIVKHGIDINDRLYLSIPSDTSGLKWNYLSDNSLAQN